MGKLQRLFGGGSKGDDKAAKAPAAAPPASDLDDNSVELAAMMAAQDEDAPRHSDKYALENHPRPDMSGSSSSALHLEKAALYAKKYGARALDAALFAPLHAIDQASILDVHAVDGLNFLASGGKTRRQRKDQDIDDAIEYEGSGLYKDLGKSDKGRDKRRETGRTGFREFASTGIDLKGSIGGLDDDKPFHHQMWGWGEDLLGFNPVRELRKTSLPRDAAPEEGDNVRLAHIKGELSDRKDAKKAKKAKKSGGG